MKKTLLKIATISAISLTGVSALPLSSINPIANAKVKKTFSTEVQGKWTNNKDDVFTIKNSNAKLKIADGKKHGTYKFKVKSKNKDKYVLKADGKKIDKTSKYSLSFNDKNIAEFKYGKYKITFNSQEVEVTKNVQVVTDDKDTNKSDDVNKTTTNSQTDDQQANASSTQASQPNSGNNQQTAPQTDNSQQPSQTQTNNDNNQQLSKYDVYTNPQMYSNRGF
ncbi:hypothetical protein ACQW5G_01380 [Fructilactobacillus sp. Tb1]|uniref:hypothetical protein n=1 Tax=Fructilactobacillus sp. Tb1 TaxID=3422304 RepID=UPI003D2BF9FD